MSIKLEKDRGCMPHQELLDRNRALEAEVEELKIRLEEAEELRRAISEGDLDALIIPGPQGKLVFTLDSADRAYRVLVETMNEGTVTFASDGTILYCNRRFAELIRMRPHAVVGASIYGFIESEDIHIFNALLNQRTSTGEIKLRSMDGIHVPVYLSISSFQSEGSQNAWCLVAMDLTEQKKNEEIVSAGRLAQSIIEQAGEAIVVCDTAGKITHFSNAVPRVCKCDPEFKRFEDILDIRFSKGKNAGKRILPVSSALKGETILGVEASLEIKDCQDFHHSLHLLLNSGPLKNTDGRIIGCVVTLTDITERKRAEEKLEAESARLKATLGAMPMGVWIADISGRIIETNEQADIIWSEPPYEPENIGDYKEYKGWWPDTGEQLRAEDWAMSRALTKGETIVGEEVEIQRFDGVFRTILNNAAPIRGSDGCIIGGVVVEQDITERKQGERALRESEERFKLLSEANSILLSSKDPENAIQTIAEKVMDHLNCDVFFNYVFDEILGSLHLSACGGISAEIAKEIEWLDKGSAICGCVALNGCRIVSEDVQHNGDKQANLVRSMGIQAYVCQPLRIGETTIGTLSFGTRNRKSFTEDELALISTVADQVSVAIERKRAENVIKTTAINLVRAERLASLGYWDWDLTTNNVKWSDGHFSIFGYTAAQGTGTYEMWRARVHPEDVEGIERVLREGMEKDMGYNWNYRLLMQDGSIRYIHAEADKPVKDASGRPVRWFGIVQDITEQKLAEDALRESRAQIEAELMDTRLLQSISAELLHEDNVQSLYEKIIDAAMQIMHSEFASIQMLYPERGKSGELKLLAFRGFNPQAANFWEWVSVDSESSCGSSLRTGKRVIIPDVENCDFMAGSKDRATYIQTGIRAVQTTPLLSRTGKLVGIISTHWRNPHQPSERDLQLLDILARQAADLIDRKQAETALRESEEKYRNIIETANEGIWIVDPEARIAYANQKIAEMLGYSHEEIIGRSAWDFTDGENKETARQNMERIKQGIDGDYELRLIRKNDSLLWTIVSAKALFDKDGNFTGSMKMLTDITERKEAEVKLKQTLDNLEKLVKERTAELEKAYNSLKESESSLAEAQKMAHLGSWYRNLITDKVYWSDEVYRIFGFKPQEFEVTIDAYFSHIHPEDRDCVKKSLKRALSGEPYSIDYRIISASGTEHIVHSQGEVVFNEKKIPVGVKGTIQDITEQKLAMEKIKKSEERVQLYLQNFRGIGTQLGKNFIPVFLHGAVEELTGYTREDFLSGKVRWNEIVVPEDRPGLQEKAQKMKSTPGMTVRHEYRIRKKNGEIRWIHGIAQNISKPDNEELYQGMMYDITDRKKAEEALEKTDKIRIKEIHHRIKNNLQVICSLLSLEAERFSDEKMLEAFKESQNRVVSMALIHEELYKGDRNDTLDFAAYIRKFTADLFSSYNVGNSSINLKTDLESVYLDMDAAVPLGIIINELISNSLKHAFPAGSEGEINISLRRTETLSSRPEESGQNQNFKEKDSYQYLLKVADNGKGIPEEVEFQNPDSLGLQLVNILIEQIDGYIGLKSNCGTEFSIFFGDKELQIPD